MEHFKSKKTMNKEIEKDIDIELEIYKLLVKLKKKRLFKKFQKFNENVLREYVHEADELDLDFLIDVIISYADKKEYKFFLNLSDFEQELVISILWGALGGE